MTLSLLPAPLSHTVQTAWFPLRHSTQTKGWRLQAASCPSYTAWSPAWNVASDLSPLTLGQESHPVPQWRQRCGLKTEAAQKIAPTAPTPYLVPAPHSPAVLLGPG